MEATLAAGDAITQKVSRVVTHPRRGLHPVRNSNLGQAMTTNAHGDNKSDPINSGTDVHPDVAESDLENTSTVTVRCSDGDVTGQVVQFRENHLLVMRKGEEEPVDYDDVEAIIAGIPYGGPEPREGDEQ